MLKIILILGIFNLVNNDIDIEINHDYLDNQIEISFNNFEEKYQEYQDYIKYHTFNGEDEIIIIDKISKNLKNPLKDKSKFIVEYSISVGLDPYLAAGVMMHETGCYWGCSYLTRVCNNVAGNKGSPGCNGGSYRKFNTLEDGIKFAINKLNSYYKKGLTTAQEINPYYASDKTWYKKVNNYINKIKNS